MFTGEISTPRYTEWKNPRGIFWILQGIKKLQALQTLLLKLSCRKTKSHNKTCCLSNNYCRCAYKLTPAIMSVCSWDLKWNLLLHTSLFERIHGQENSRQRGTGEVTGYRQCAYGKSTAMRLGKDCVKGEQGERTPPAAQQGIRGAGEAAWCQQVNRAAGAW